MDTGALWGPWKISGSPSQFRGISVGSAKQDALMTHPRINKKIFLIIIILLDLYLLAKIRMRYGKTKDLSLQIISKL